MRTNQKKDTTEDNDTGHKNDNKDNEYNGECDDTNDRLRVQHMGKTRADYEYSYTTVLVIDTVLKGEWVKS